MCRLLTISRSGFYAWLKRPVSTRQQRRIRVGEAAEAVFIGFKQRYGAPRVTFELNAQGIGCSVNHVALLLQEKGYAHVMARDLSIGHGLSRKPMSEITY